MTADRRRRGRAIRKARRQVAALTDQQRENLRATTHRALPFLREFFDALREAVINTAKLLVDCGRAFIQMSREVFTLWPPRPKPRTIIHNGRKP